MALRAMTNATFPAPRYANDFIERLLDDLAETLGEACDGADVLAFNGPLIVPVDEALRRVVEQMCGSSHRRRPKLCMVLTSTGGYIEVVQRMVDTLRHHYRVIEVIVPNYAYSAGTVLAMAGDAIYMNYFSRLGPIDPQVNSARGIQVAALGYLIQYERLLQKAQTGTITPAEVAILLRFDQAELYDIEQARELSVELLKQWLVRYKFKNWKVTRTHKTPVTRAMKVSRAEEIARKLNNTDKWHSHSYGISMDVLQRDLNVTIENFDDNADVSEAITEYHTLLDDYMIKRSDLGVMHAVGQYVPFLAAV